MGYWLLFVVNLPIMLLMLLIAALFYYYGYLSGNSWSKQYGYIVAYAVDQLANAVLGGAPDETISQRTAKALKSGRPLWWVKYFGKFVDILAVIVAQDYNHIEKSITDRVGQQELWSWIEDENKEKQ